MTAANAIIHAKRTALGLTDSEVAIRAGLSPSEYFDVELHEDEAFKVVHLGSMRKLCHVLHLDLLDLFGIQCAFCDTGPVADPVRSRNEFVRGRRMELRMSEEELADRIGFDAASVRDMEQKPGYLDDWSVELVLTLAHALGVPAQVLLGVKCSRCGK